MELTARNVEIVFNNCLCENEESTQSYIKAEGIVNIFGFHPERIKKYKDDIYKMLKQLPDAFQKETGGGMSFLNACDNKNGDQWTGLHQIMEQLVVLGIAIDKVKYCLPKPMWSLLPGSMPYFVIE